jgi:hypothetical protein
MGLSPRWMRSADWKARVATVCAVLPAGEDEQVEVLRDAWLTVEACKAGGAIMSGRPSCRPPERSGIVGLMRSFVIVIVTAFVVVALLSLTSWRDDEASANTLSACANQSEGLPLTRVEKEEFISRCMSYGHYLYSQQCGDPHAAKCYTPPGLLTTKWFELRDCMRFEEGSFEGSFRGCIRTFLNK